MHRRVHLLRARCAPFNLAALTLSLALAVAVPVAAQPGAGVGVFLDLGGCLIAPGCTGTVAMASELRLVLGQGPLKAHLELLRFFPTAASFWFPFAAIHLRFQVAPTVAISPYLGWAPVLAAAHTPAPGIDWLFKFGDVISFSGGALFAEVVLPLPLTPVPALAFGALLEF